MLTEKDYCDYETCVALKELGYIGSSRYYYTQRDHKFHYDAYNKFYTVRTADAMGYVLAVHLYDAQKWLREEKDVIIVVCPYTYDIINKTHTWTCEIWFGDNLEYGIHNFKSYEEALSIGIMEVVEILKDGVGE